MLGLVVYPLAIAVVVWPLGPPLLRVLVAVAAVLFAVSSTIMKKEPGGEMNAWENAWAAVGLGSVAVAIGGGLAAIVLGPA